MSKRSKRLDPVRTLRDQQVQEEAKRLAAAAQAHQAAVQQLADLERYLHDYYTGPQNGQMVLQSTQDLMLYQQFVVKLNDAINRQRQFVSLKEVAWKHAQKRWLEAKTKVDAIDKLVTKIRLDDEKKENKRDQRLSDEFAARIFRTQNPPQG